jgi:hypothetical protein
LASNGPLSDDENHGLVGHQSGTRPPNLRIHVGGGSTGAHRVHGGHGDDGTGGGDARRLVRRPCPTDQSRRRQARHPRVLRRTRGPEIRRLAIVLDIDDTSLSNYSYGAENDFDFGDRTKTNQCALAEKLPVIPATRALAKSAHDHGVAEVFVTGRPHALANVTLDNLKKAGYPAATGAFFAPDAGPVPAYLHCRGTCTTVQYKSRTRAHIESSGYDVIADVGDQQSDLAGGHADATYKLPNPMCIIP